MASQSFLGAAGNIARALIPFAPGMGPYDEHYPFQALMADPTHPAGFRLSNAITINYVPPAPTVTLVEANAVAPGTSFIVHGTNFALTPAQNTVRVGGQAWPVTAAAPGVLV